MIVPPPPPPPPSSPPPLAGFGQSDDNHDVAILAGTAVTTFVTTIIVGMRMYVRHFMVRSVGRDDYWILASLFLSLVGFFLIIPEVQYGAGRHMYYIMTDPKVGPAGAVIGFKLNFITQFTYVFALAFVKVSIGLFLLRFTLVGKYKALVYCTLGFLAFYTIAGTAALMAGCRPFAANFDRSLPEYTCYTPKVSRALAFTNSSCGIFTDLIFAFLPVPLLWKLQINRRLKFSLIVILSLGLFAASASVVKLYYLTFYGQFGDLLWDSTYLTIWSATEVNVAITAASIPAIKPLFSSILGGSYGANSHAYRSRDKNQQYAQQSSGHRDTIYKSRQSSTREFELGDLKKLDRERDKLDKDKDNISEESILPLQGAEGDWRGILKTTKITIRSEEGHLTTVEDRV